MPKPTPALQGKRILVTRTREQASVLSERLRALEAIPIEFPTIHIVPPLDWGPLDEALQRLCTSPGRRQGETTAPQDAGKLTPIGTNVVARATPPTPGRRQADAPTSDDGVALPTLRYDWLVFTSANGVNTCFERLGKMGYDAQDISDVRVAAIGPATAAALKRHGITADLVPNEYIAEQVAAALIEDVHGRGESLRGKRILVARAAEARKVLVTTLQEEGAVVDDVAAYRTVTVANDDEQGREVLRLLQTQQFDILTFTSSSTVRNFMQWLMNCASEIVVTTNPQLKIACIGPITSQTARELGLDVHIEASEFTIDGLVEAIVQHEEGIRLQSPT